jgi:rare lipoprotein A (peptidoglycan hydrolase)
MGAKNDRLVELSMMAVRNLAYNKKFSFKIKIQKIDTITIRSNDYEKINDSIVSIDTLNWMDVVTGKNYQKTGKKIKGVASFYSANLDGTKTATGEIFRNSKYTAASNNLKLNTLVLVTNLKNKKSVVVRINDRMHPRMAKKGRVVDLSRIAAKALDFMENGLTKVSVETIVLQNDQKQSIPVTQKDSSSKTQSVVIPVKDSLLKDSLPSRENLLDGADSVITGLAGIYSAHSEGAKMANGGIFHHKKLTAAANQFKLNSWVKLTNFKNNKTVILKITDRVSKLEIQRGFVIELSQAAAKEVDINSKGYQMVKLEKLKR